MEETYEKIGCRDKDQNSDDDCDNSGNIHARSPFRWFYYTGEN